MNIDKEVGKVLRANKVKVYPSKEAKNRLWRWRKNKPRYGYWVGVSRYGGSMLVRLEGQKTYRSYARIFWRLTPSPCGWRSIK